MLSDQQFTKITSTSNKLIKNALRRGRKKSNVITWIMLTIIFGSITSGKRRILNSEMATKALDAVSSFPVKT